jgi:hypothetical protein
VAAGPFFQEFCANKKSVLYSTDRKKELFAALLSSKEFGKFNSFGVKRIKLYYGSDKKKFGRIFIIVSDPLLI